MRRAKNRWRTQSQRSVSRQGPTTAFSRSELLISGLRALLNHSGNSFESPWFTENLSNRLVCSAEEIEVVPSTLVLSLIRRKVPRHKHCYRSSHMAPPQSITRLAPFVR